ncbi:hydantoinase/oxoprolinase family protein [Agrobacterium rosae]|uniref:Methylhydantoinase n=1 Tax=Agrobacterium rosae TaxID=1972867 RepID=A0AAE5RSL8_9HYPH|nr:hydantoinase/oxoprolinase family protein [Agrobacterium rosae]KAA3507515.1 hydantoinase/oxoprolinase family protein [Agrobacterium rosae]KAA3511961.1 hydantoinase/oxoprolinase family protein [Agrobacterium rosae]MCM2435523.1 hydantoinase/oxoprolinase family protein [Agrobacterium rosae]MDX8312897.1 hydantoinase/oxoprolinase family protein [Agrobacterium rosae]MQB51319.1 hydantoinase/oxoprolinase family protein [Agrobacterium rosae]
MAKLAFDTGGTFTDFALLDDNGELHLHKVLSTPKNPAEAVVQGVSELLENFSGAIAIENLQVLGATTVVTNAVLERKGVETGFVTTDGFQDMLRIRNEGRYDLYDLNIKYPDPLVARANSYGAQERIAADGTVMTELKEDTVREIAIKLKDKGIRSVAVCLLHAYKYPQHEQRVAALLREEYPDIFVSLSSEVCPEMREFDRASTTVVNAYTRPQMAGHVANLQREFAAKGIDRQVLWMTSSGGLVPSSRAAELPVRLIESGPAAGAVAAAEFGRIAGEDSVLSFDMGGTTAKLCLIPHGEPTVGTDLEVAHYQRFRKGSGFPLKIQSIQMIEIGAGGGSIAAKNPLGLLDVGPHSAGAMPGPAAYQRGGIQPTVTDADILLGYMGTESFVGGSFKVSKDAAREAMAKLATSLDVSVDRCAWGIHDLVNESMSKAAAMHATDLGVDPRSLPMVAFGGAGPVHAYGIARKLGIKRVICPTGAGVTSAIGLLIAPVAVDLSASHPMGVDAWDMDAMNTLLDDLSAQGAEVVSAAGVGKDTITNRYTVDMRHVGQGHEITVVLPDRKLPKEEFLKQLLDNFFKLYKELFGRTVAASVEVITWRLRASGEKDQVTRPHETQVADAKKGSREVYFQELGKYTETSVYDHYKLPVGHEIKGPAIVEQRESTAVVGPSGVFHVDARGNLVINIL